MAGEGERTVEQRLRAALEWAPSGMLMVDSAGVIVLVNREVERIFGYTREELVGTLVERLVPERFRGSHEAFRGSFLRDPQARAMGGGRELHGQRKDGTEVPVEIGLNPIQTEEGLFVLGSIVDISARKRAEEERQRLEAELQQGQKLMAVGALASGVAHDFNNILAAIVGYAELLDEQIADRPDCRRDVQALLAVAARGKAVIERILRFSRREAVLHLPLELPHTIADASMVLRATLPSTIELRVRVAPDTPRVRADATSLHQILMNLATNAAHAMPGGGQLEIELEPVYVRDSMVRANPELREGPHARLTVRDTGSGMSTEVQARVFDPFFTTKIAGSGSGLGLAIVRSLMREHQGAVTLESEPGRGTVVRCYFPATTEESPVPATTERAPRGQGERILYVDDEPAVAAVGSRRLGMLGYEVTVSLDPEDALARVEADPAAFHLVVTDFTMPRLTGLELARRIHAVQPGLPIILMTGSVGDIPEALAWEAGIRKMLQKPLALLELATAVAQVLGRA